MQFQVITACSSKDFVSEAIGIGNRSVRETIRD